MSFAATCEGWAEDLTTHVPELTTAVVHLYAPWSPELFQARVGEFHLAVFPEGEPETSRPLIAGTPPADEIETLYQVNVWQGAVAADARLVEDPDADRAWLQLYEAVRARLYVVANANVGGELNAYTRYAGGRLFTQNSCRAMVLGFRVRWSLSFV